MGTHAPPLPSPAPRDDAEPASAVARGDSAALAEVYDRHGARCFAVALRVIGDRSLAEDVVQEVFLAFWRGSAARFDAERGRLSSWLIAVTHHRAVDIVRREENVHRRQSPEEALAFQPDDDRPVDEQAAATVSGDEVRAALRELPASQREALVLAYFGGYTQREIADRVGVPLGTVKTRTLAALRRLRTSLSPNGPEVGQEGGQR